MKKSGLIDGAIIATLAIIVSKILGVLYVIPFYKIIGEQGGALYGYAYNIYNIFLIISSAGIPMAISKLTSEYETQNQKEKKEKMYTIAQKLVFIFAISSFLICFIFSKFIAQLIIGELSGGNTIDDVSFVIKCISFALIIVPLLSVFRGYLQGHKYISVSSYSQVIEQIVRIIIILIGSYTTLKVFNLPLKISVGTSVLSACGGAIIAYIYLHYKCKKYKLIPKKLKIDKQEKKEIIKKIIHYSIPFIIINISYNIYNTTDMIFIIRGLNKIGYNASTIENISSVFTTWGDKIINIIKAFATGLAISLTPTLVSSYVKKDTKETNKNFNKALQIIIYIIFPLTLLMSIFTPQVWKIFYNDNQYGIIILQYLLLVSAFDCCNIIIGSSLQAMYKTKLIYISTFIGLTLNLILDLPLLYLFNKLNIYPFYGPITASLISYTANLGIPLIYLKIKEGFSYKETIKHLPKFILSLLIIIVIAVTYKHFITVPNKYILNIVYLLVVFCICGIIYFIINLKFLLSLLKNSNLPFFSKKDHKNEEIK